MRGVLAVAAAVVVSLSACATTSSEGDERLSLVDHALSMPMGCLSMMQHAADALLPDRAADVAGEHAHTTDGPSEVAPSP